MYRWPQCTCEYGIRCNPWFHDRACDYRRAYDAHCSERDDDYKEERVSENEAANV